MANPKDIPVRVALRSRPLVPKEISEGCQECLRFISCNQQVVLGNNKAFTYDFVFSKDTEQEIVYTKAVKPLVDGIFKGYNATVLAYGQTGSGKTFSMGSGYSASQAPSDPSRGVIPRVITSLFEGVKQHEDMSYILRVSYLEIHNEDIHDLLNSSTKKENIAIRESVEGGIHIVGLKEITVQSAEDMYMCLEQGSLGRTTASTAMNSTSSRSHAIFTIHIDQKTKDSSDSGWHAKFHLVDLAGSERVKKTHAEGDRFREGVNINRGLLALGNVISALGDENGRKGHVPYRNAKLTRLLQDSLGGNSQTLMIACVSPADSNMEETLNTLRYADRARRITNKAIVNRDPKEAEISRLRQQVQQLQVQLAQCNGGALPSDLKSMRGGADMSILLERNKSLEADNQKLTNELQSAIDQTTVLCEKVILAEMAKDKLKQKIEELRVQADISIDALNLSMDTETTDVKEQFKGQLDMLKNMQKKILEVQATERMDHSDLLSVQHNDSNSSNEENTLTEKSKDENISDTTDDQTFFKHHTLRQAEMGRELLDLNNALSLKQELVAKMGLSDEKMAVMKMQYEQSSKQLENEVNHLMKEKDELSSALHAAKFNVNSSKVSEQRRKRLLELEGQISDMKKKITEQNKLLKFKEQSVKAVDKLNNEIHSMKQARVKLMRHMKEDGEKVRTWKAAKNKEVLQLKAQDRKRQCEYAKLERVHVKQQHVLRRKMEEASAANRRLKEAMQKQKAAAESRGRFDERNQQGVGKRIRSFLEHELEVLVSINEAKRHLASLITDRKAIMKQLADLNRVPPNKKSKMSDGSESETPDKKTLAQDLEMRNAQISDLQQKIVDADQDDKEKSRWKSINSIIEAKCALKWLMETAVVGKVTNGVRIGEVRDLQTSLDEATKTICEGKSLIEEVKKTHQQELTMVQQSHEEKILYLLKQMPQAAELSMTGCASSNDQELLGRLQFQEKQITDLHGLHEQLQAINSENDTLKKQLTLANYHGKKLSLMPAMTSPDATPSPAPKPVKKMKKKTTAVRKEEHYSIEELHTLFSSDEESNSMDSDSDWQATPMFKRARKVIKKVSLPKDFCRCKGTCSTKRCSCTKNGSSCSGSCSCLQTMCINDGRSKPSDCKDTSQMNTTVVLDSTNESIPPSTLNFSDNTAKSEETTFSRPVFSKLDNSNSNKEKDVRKRPMKVGNDCVTSENSDPEVSGPKKKRKLLSNSKPTTFFKPLVKF